MSYNDVYITGRSSPDWQQHTVEMRLELELAHDTRPMRKKPARKFAVIKNDMHT